MLTYLPQYVIHGAAAPTRGHHTVHTVHRLAHHHYYGDGGGYAWLLTLFLLAFPLLVALAGVTYRRAQRRAGRHPVAAYHRPAVAPWNPTTYGPPTPAAPTWSPAPPANLGAPAATPSGSPSPNWAAPALPARPVFPAQPVGAWPAPTLR